MSEPTHTSQDISKSAAAERTTDGKGERPAEPRSFQAADEAERKARSATARAAAAGAEAGQAVAMREGSGEIAEVWRSSMEAFTAMQLELRHAFDDAWRRALGVGWRAPMQTAHPFAGGAAPLFGQPPADVRECADAYHLAIELPGMTRSDIDLSVREGMITVCGHKAEEAERASGVYRMSERRFGRFERSFPIPRDVDRSHIEASFRDGLLRVTLPRRADAAQPAAKIEVRG